METTSAPAPRTSPSPLLRIPSLLTGCTALGLLLLASPAHAVDFYWGSNTTGDTSAAATSWQDATHWFSNAGGTAAAGAAPGSTDKAIFSIDALNGTALIPRIWTDTTIGGLSFKNTQAFNMTGGGANRILNIGSQGVDIASGSASITLGTSAANQNVYVKFSANQTWTNNANNTIRIRNGDAGASNGAGNVVVTMNTAGSGNITSDGGFNDGTGSTFGLIVDSTGTGYVGFGSSAHSGGTTIKRGMLQAGGSSAGTTAINLGDISGSSNATLRINTTSAFTTGLVAVAGNTGVNTLEFSQTSGTYDGNIVLNNALHVAVRQQGASGATINGAISGTGDLIKGQYQNGNSQILTLAGHNTYTGDTVINNGAFTLAETGTLTFSIGANGVNNSVTGTSTGAVIFNGTFSFNLGGANRTDGNEWRIVDTTLANTSFSGTFAVSGFSESSNVWTNGSGFSFDEGTGILSYTASAIPEPAAAATLAGLMMLGLAATRRRRLR